jgi:raffinose/stachyose/melibiose transport system substrate-binding protein
MMNEKTVLAATGPARRAVLAAFAVGATGLALTACSGPSASKAAGTGVAGTINLWYSLPTSGSSSQAAAQYKKYSIDPFTKLHPAVSVNPVPNNVNTIDQKIKVALAAGAGPDIIPTPGSANAVPYAQAGYLADLTAEAKKNNWANTILPWALNMGYIKGKLVALPTSYESLVLYYNKTLFDKNGWTPPTDRASLESLMSQMKAKGIIPFAAGNASYQPATEWLVSAFMNEVAGPQKVHDAIAGKIKWSDPALVQSISLLLQYFDAGYFGGGTKQYFSTQDPQKYAGFADGKSAMYISGSWEMYTFPDYFGKGGNTAEWAWAPLPPLAAGVPQGIFPLSVGGTISVNAKSPNVNTGKAYVDWMFSDTKTMWEQVKQTGSEPLPIKYQPSDVPKGVDPRYVAQYSAINDASTSGKVGYVTWTSFGGAADTYIIQHIDKVLNHSLTVDAFISGLQQAFDSDKAAGLIPPLFETKA